MKESVIFKFSSSVCCIRALSCTVRAVDKRGAQRSFTSINRYMYGVYFGQAVTLPLECPFIPSPYSVQIMENVIRMRTTTVGQRMRLSISTGRLRRPKLKARIQTQR